jgi:two-component system, OmpR family, osmolarity sensor histidine kinase EnvZ
MSSAPVNSTRERTGFGYSEHAMNLGRRRRNILKRFLPRTLFGRAIMIIVTPVVLVQLIATVVFYDRHWETISERLSKSVAGEIALVIGEMQRDNSPENRQRLFDLAASSTALLISYQEGAKLDPRPPRAWWDPYVQRWLNRALSEQIPHRFRVDPWFAKSWVEISVQLDGGVLRVIAPLRRFFSTTIYVFLLWMVGSSVLLFSIAIIFMRNQIRPIRRLASAAEAFGKGRETAQAFKPEGADEVRQAGLAFLVMRDRLTRQIEQRTAMLAGVSHDLRTPLTRMRLQLEMMGEDEEINDLRSDLSEMQTMLEGYLAFARGEGGEETQPTDLSAMLGEICNQASRHGGKVASSLESGITLPVRPVALRRALNNLITNACRYADQVWVGMKREANSVSITIDDDGPGIPEPQREEVFKPFMRLDPSRNPETGGIGLGLTISRDIIRRHGGDVLLSDSERGGLSVTVYLPV